MPYRSFSDKPFSHPRGLLVQWTRAFWFLELPFQCLFTVFALHHPTHSSDGVLDLPSPRSGPRWSDILKPEISAQRPIFPALSSLPTLSHLIMFCKAGAPPSSPSLSPPSWCHLPSHVKPICYGHCLPATKQRCLSSRFQPPLLDQVCFGPAS